MEDGRKDPGYSSMCIFSGWVKLKRRTLIASSLKRLRLKTSEPLYSVSHSPRKFCRYGHKGKSETKSTSGIAIVYETRYVITKPGNADCFSCFMFFFIACKFEAKLRLRVSCSISCGVNSGTSCFFMCFKTT